MTTIPYGRQSINEEDIEAVVSVLRSDFLTQGPKVEEFEAAVAKYCGARYAVAVTNATAALHISCLALELGPNDWLWTSPNTFLASANCALYAGANVDFVDIDPATYNISATALAKKLEIAKREGRVPKVLVPVHFAGQSCAMREIHELCQAYGVRILEDASHAIGGTYQNKPVGSCQYSDAAVFSFHPVKIITTGEGGMILTNNQKLFESLRLLRSHGMTRNAAKMTEPSHGDWYYQQILLGFNYRLTDLHSALGLSQMKRIDQLVSTRQELADRYDSLLKGFPITLPKRNIEGKSALHLYPIRVKAPAKRAEIFSLLRKSGVGVNVHYIPVHLQPYYRELGFHAGQFPEAEAYYQETISLPLFADLSFADQDRVVEALKTALRL